MTHDSSPTTTTRAEIDRDARMIALALLRELLALTGEQLTLALGCDRVDPPPELHRRLESLLADSRAHHRQLNDARINRRGRPRPTAPASPPPPPHLLPFARNGTYAGAYPDLEALALAHNLPRELSPDLAAALGRYLDLAGLGLRLHLEGALWTLVDTETGEIHAFVCDPKAPDSDR